MSGRSRRSRRGGAMVEFAILQVVLVPLLLYSLFLMDVPHLFLETQETAISTVWDYSTRNDESGSDADIAMRLTKTNAVLWSDHNSAYEAGVYPGEHGYKDLTWAKGTPHEIHHVGFGAQYAFQFSNGPDTQLNCNQADRDTGAFDSEHWEADLSWAVDPSFNSFAGSSHALGGLGRCFTTAYIYNYIVPQTFLQEFSRVEMTRMKYRGENGVTGGTTSHEWQGDTSALFNIPVFEQAAVSFNTWALRNGAADGNVNNADLRQPPRSNPFMARVEEVNGSGPQAATWNAARLAATRLSTTALSEDLMAIPVGTPVANLPVPVDLYLQARYQPNSPGLRVEAPGIGGEDYESTPYSDVNDEYQSAYGNRGNHYLGCSSAETYPCP